MYVYVYISFSISHYMTMKCITTLCNTFNITLFFNLDSFSYQTSCPGDGNTFLCTSLHYAIDGEYLWTEDIPQNCSHGYGTGEENEKGSNTVTLVMLCNY